MDTGSPDPVQGGGGKRHDRPSVPFDSVCVLTVSLSLGGPQPCSVAEDGCLSVVLGL